MTREERVRRALEANNTLSSDLISEAFTELENVYLGAWKQGKTVEAREDAHRYVMVLDRFKSHLQEIIQSGQLAQKELEDLEGRKKFRLMG